MLGPDNELSKVPVELNPVQVNNQLDVPAKNKSNSWLGKAISYVPTTFLLNVTTQVTYLAAAAIGSAIAFRTGNDEIDDNGLTAAKAVTVLSLGVLLMQLSRKNFSKAAKQFGLAAVMTYLISNKMARDELYTFKQYATLVQDPRSHNAHKIPALLVTQLDGSGSRYVDAIKLINLLNEVNELESKLSSAQKLQNTDHEDLKNIEHELTKQYQLIESFSSETLETILPMQITFGTTYIAGNPQRDALSEMVAKTHEEYAKRWNLVYNPVTENLLVGRCDRSYYDTEKVDCVPYWNKIAVLLDCLSRPQIHQEEWCVVVDDDMPVTNMNVDPRDAINKLRRGVDSSVIVARDVAYSSGDTATAVNTGALFVRKDDNGRELVNLIWERRNDRGSGSNICRTLGTCKNQETLHEQTAMTNVLKDDRSLLNRVVTVVLPRDTYDGQEIALNTFERSGCFIRKQEHWGSERIDYSGMDYGYPEGAWREGDWMGQTAGVPVHGWYCGDYNRGKNPGPIRRDKLKKMIEKTVK